MSALNVYRGDLCQTVLVVAGEDDEAAAAVIGRITDGLRDEGYDVLRATTARDGVTQIRGSGRLDHSTYDPGVFADLAVAGEAVLLE